MRKPRREPGSRAAIRSRGKAAIHSRFVGVSVATDSSHSAAFSAISAPYLAKQIGRERRAVSLIQHQMEGRRGQ